MKTPVVCFPLFYLRSSAKTAKVVKLENPACFALQLFWRKKCTALLVVTDFSERWNDVQRANVLLKMIPFFWMCNIIWTGRLISSHKPSFTGGDVIGNQLT
eukprot:TRINITY_DN3487_c0_g2_i3.p1 TRINITY_DN3487_c0_g2~~TRINITY_DN3487_c0_g2_i3.p1  ORF type:complete len:101 (-),score=7.82 TRINITY_DN3487_c0_g2_i3:404-706(-)